MADSTNKPGLGSNNMDDKTKEKIHSMGGKASHAGANTTSKSNTSGAAGKTDAAKRGGEHSSRS